jgi:membrane-bound lytic murein transglycosylase B
MGRIRGTSSAGAQGPMQFLPSTWARYGEGGDINDPRDSIMAAGRYLKAAGAPGDLGRALYAYNHSQHYVRAVTLYAEQMRTDERTYAGYHAWQVYYITPSGDALLPEGYGS